MITFVEYPIASEISDSYEITVNGKRAHAIKTRVSAMPFNRLWPGKQRSLEQTEFVSYISISTDEQILDFSLNYFVAILM